MRIIVAAVVVAALSAIAAPAPRAQSSSAGPAPELTALDYVQIRQLVARYARTIGAMNAVSWCFRSSLVYRMQSIF